MHGQEARGAVLEHHSNSKEWQSIKNVKKKLQQWLVIFAIGHSGNAGS